jgi:transposase-like protein
MYNIDKQCLPRGVISLVAKQFNYSKTTISKIWTTGQQSIIQQQQQQEQILQQQNLPHLEKQQQENPLREIAKTVALSSLATASSSSSSTQSNYMNNINANSKNIIIKPIFSMYSKRIYIQKYDVPMMLQKLESIPLIERTSLRKCAELLNVSSSSLHKWIKNYRADYCNNIENQCNNTTTTTTVPVSNYLLDSIPTSTGNDNTTSSTTTCNTINSISTSTDNSISINNNNGSTRIDGRSELQHCFERKYILLITTQRAALLATLHNDNHTCTNDRRNNHRIID